MVEPALPRPLCVHLLIVVDITGSNCTDGLTWWGTPSQHGPMAPMPPLPSGGVPVDQDRLPLVGHATNGQATIRGGCHQHARPPLQSCGAVTWAGVAGLSSRWRWLSRPGPLSCVTRSPLGSPSTLPCSALWSLSLSLSLSVTPKIALALAPARAASW